MNIGKRFVRSALLAAAVALAPFAVADDFSIEAVQGEVESVDFTVNRIVVGGVAYQIAPDASVQIAGTYGAPTMLLPGMKLKVMYRRYPDGVVEIIDAKELPAGAELEQY
jgi:hypothetical protein